ncbi:MAG: hypothetical protein M3Q40_09330, partial [Pseudomonadota bacterium]|nr:hypothetical protein [Pseudomonadota bacterium]
MSALRHHTDRPPAREHVGRVLGALLDAPDVPDFASRVACYLDGEGFTGVAVVWRGIDGQVHAHRPAALRQGDSQLVLDAQRLGTCAPDHHGGRVAAWIQLQEDGPGLGLVCDREAGTSARVHEQCGLLAPMARTIFEKARLTESLRQLERSEQLQSALFAIADMASSGMDLGEMLRELHGIVGRFMYAENFYIALYDENVDALRFIYLVDTEDPVIRDAREFVPMAAMERGLTWYLVRDKRPLMGSLDDMRAQVSGPMRDIGVDCLDWLGVPIILGDAVRGALVVQSYIERPRY